MLQLEVLIGKRFPVDGLAAGAVVVGEVSALKATKEVQSTQPLEQRLVCLGFGVPGT